jgi:hypothetical protein
MAMAKSSDNLAIMQMALDGYEIEKQSIEERIREIRSLLGGRGIRPGPSQHGPSQQAAAVVSATPLAKRMLSAAARRRIAAAQRKRWSEYRKRKAQGG